MSKSPEIDGFADEAEDYENDKLDSLVEQAGNRPARQAKSKQQFAAWRSVEDYFEQKRLEKQLAEFYDGED